MNKQALRRFSITSNDPITRSWSVSTESTHSLIPKAQAERETKENLASGRGGPPAIKDSTGKKSSPKHDVVEDMDDDEESMDWWTKYFASVDAMIEVNYSKIYFWFSTDLMYILYNSKCKLIKFRIILKCKGRNSLYRYYKI